MTIPREGGRPRLTGRRTDVRRARRLAIGLSALATLGAAGSASAAPPDLFPFVPSEGVLEPARWYVDTSVDGGVYSARLHFSTQVVNVGGPLALSAGAASGTVDAPLAAAVQTVEGGAPTPLGPTVRLIGRKFGDGAYGWGVDGIARYTLTPAVGAPVDSALGATCREDNAIFSEPGAPPAVAAAFAPAGSTIGGNIAALSNCGPNLPQTGAGFSSGISTGWQDVIDLNSDNAAYFDISAMAPGPGTFRARVDPGGEINQGGASANDTELRTLDVPGVVALPKAGVLASTGKVGVQLAASVKEPQVRGRRITPTSPSSGADAAPAGSAVRFFVADPPARGTVAINETTGQSFYTGNAGSTAADSFTYVAEDSRGLRSVPAKVFIDPPGSAPRIGLGRPDIVATVLKKTRTFRAGQSVSFTVKVPKGQKSATFAVSWAAGRYTLQLRTPGSKKNVRVGKTVKLTKGRTFRSFTVVNPKAGAWKLIVTRQSGGPKNDKATIRASLQRRG